MGEKILPDDNVSGRSDSNSDVIIVIVLLLGVMLNFRNDGEVRMTMLMLMFNFISTINEWTDHGSKIFKL